MSIDKVPDEILMKVVAACDPIDRKILRITSRRFRRLCDQFVGSYAFHVQGNWKELFLLGINSLLGEASRKIRVNLDEARISKFNLNDLHDSFPNLVDSSASRTVKTLRIDQCVISAKVVILLLKALPSVEDLQIFRCVQLETNPDALSGPDDLRRIGRLVVSSPLWSNAANMRGLIETCSPDILLAYRSVISKNRPVIRRLGMQITSELRMVYVTQGGVPDNYEMVTIDGAQYKYKRTVL